MLKRIREMKDQDGFTLIELMVVVLIIAILIAIAIPTFLGLRRRAQNRAAQSSLRNALTAAKGFYTDNDTYSGFDTGAAVGADTGAAESIEPSLDFVPAASASTGPNVVSIKVASNATPSQLLLVGKSASGTFFAICDNGTGIRYGQGTADITAMTGCTATSWT